MKQNEDIAHEENCVKLHLCVKENKDGSPGSIYSINGSQEDDRYYTYIGKSNIDGSLMFIENGNIDIKEYLSLGYKLKKISFEEGDTENTKVTIFNEEFLRLRHQQQ